MEVEGIIRAYQKLLPNWHFETGDSWSEDFAVARYQKKMEEPDDSKAQIRRRTCFDDYVEFDCQLPTLTGLYPRKWYIARDVIHKVMSSFRLAPVSFTNGSEVKPTRGYNSLESKLMRSAWHCTPECFELWAETAYETMAIKRATRKRLARTMGHDSHKIKAFHKESWKLYKGRANAPFLCFRRMLAVVTHRYEASRFTTVRKNNKVDRPISVDGLCNMLVQRRVGNGIRALLKEEFGVELNELAAQHRRLIRDATKATIDLKNASDCVSCRLIDFLFPKRFLKTLYASRAPYLEGLDGHYHVLKKISSMGCGYTFELMTLVLLALGRQHDTEFSVFGDDIIVANSAARSLMSDLTAVGFVVNEEKSHVYSHFRESCGANWHDDYGYIRSFDFWYPETIHDCIVVYNKAHLLGELYPQFRKLAVALARPVPAALQGPSDVTWQQVVDRARGRDEDVLLSSYFKTGRFRGGLKVDDRSFSRILDGYQLKNRRGIPLKRRYFYGFKWNPKTASKRTDTLTMKHHCGKYSMYLHGGRRIDDVVTNRGVWQKVTWAQVGQRAFRVQALVALSKLLPETSVPLKGTDGGRSVPA